MSDRKKKISEEFKNLITASKSIDPFNLTNFRNWSSDVTLLLERTFGAESEQYVDFKKKTNSIRKGVEALKEGNLAFPDSVNREIQGKLEIVKQDLIHYFNFITKNDQYDKINYQTKNQLSLPLPVLTTSSSGNINKNINQNSEKKDQKNEKNWVEKAQSHPVILLIAICVAVSVGTAGFIDFFILKERDREINNLKEKLKNESGQQHTIIKNQPSSSPSFNLNKRSEINKKIKK